MKASQVPRDPPSHIGAVTIFAEKVLDPHDTETLIPETKPLLAKNLKGFLDILEWNVQLLSSQYLREKIYPRNMGLIISEQVHCQQFDVRAVRSNLWIIPDGCLDDAVHEKLLSKPTILVIDLAFPLLSITCHELSLADPETFLATVRRLVTLTTMEMPATDRAYVNKNYGGHSC